MCLLSVEKIPRAKIYVKIADMDNNYNHLNYLYYFSLCGKDRARGLEA